MWIWTHLGIFFVLSLLVCLCGFKKYVYFMYPQTESQNKITDKPRNSTKFGNI